MPSNELQSPKKAPARTTAKYQPRAGDPKINQNFNDNKAHHVRVKDAYLEPLAKLVRDRYESAKKHRATQRLGDSTVEEVLHRCWRQVEGVSDPCLIDLREESGVDLNLNLSLLKVDAFHSWTKSILAEQEDLPLVVQPTTIPDLSKAGQAEALSKVKAEIFLGDPEANQDISALVRRVKAEVLAQQQIYANSAAQNMETLMRDQAEEGGFRELTDQGLRDIAIYPYAVGYGPIPTLINTIEWRNGRLARSQRLIMGTRRKSPFDLYWSDDSPNTQDGTFVTITDRFTPKMLMEAAQMKSYVRPNVLAALQHFMGVEVNRDWLNKNPEAPSDSIWQQSEQVDVITMHGSFSGRDLQPYGLQVSDAEMYESTVKVLGPYVIQVQINKNPGPFKRPVHTASMSGNGETIPGIGICQKVRDTERGYHSALRGLVKNLHFSAGPIGEVDFARIARWIKEDELGIVNPYELTPTDPDIMGSSKPAYTFHNVQSHAQSLIGVMEFFERTADRVTQIPAAFHGEAVGTGVNRTFRGVSLLQGNALKGLQSSMVSFGKGIIKPHAEIQYMHNMMYHPDDSVKGDSQVNVRDIAGLLEREVKKQSSVETLTLVAQIAQAAELPEGALTWAVNQALESAGVDMERFAATERSQKDLAGAAASGVSADQGAPGGSDAIPT